MVHQVEVGQTRIRIRDGDVGGFKQGVVKVNLQRRGDPSKIRVNIDEEEGFRPVQKMQHRLDDGFRNFRPESAVRRRVRSLQNVHRRRRSDLDFLQPVLLQGVSDSAHRRNQLEPGRVRLVAQDLVSDEEVPDLRFRVERHDVGVHPFVGECLVVVDFGDELIRHHYRDLKVGALDCFEDFRVCAVDFDAFGFEFLNELNRFLRGGEIVAQFAIADPNLRLQCST